MIGGIYVGAFTPTEAAGMGAAGAIAIAYFRGALSWKILLEVARETTLTTAKLFVVVFGVKLRSNAKKRDGNLVLVHALVKRHTHECTNM